MVTARLPYLRSIPIAYYSIHSKITSKGTLTAPFADTVTATF